MINKNLEKLGYDDFFQSTSPEYTEDGFSRARVMEVNKNSYVVSDGMHEMKAELTGKFLFDAIDATAFPTVGDWVTIQAMDDYILGIIHEVLPRKTLLKRKESGKKVAFQLIASNIDYGLIVQSANHINSNLLDRYLVMLHDSGIEPVIIITKIDLVEQSELDEITHSLSHDKVKILYISNISDEGVGNVKEMLAPGKTYCLLGQSGVGKSSLLNNLIGSYMLEVSSVRETDGKGRHTTVRRQLVVLDSGSMFIDTPGMRELGNFDVSDGLAQTFDKFSSYGESCRFTDCTHTHEKGCAIIAAVENGDIPQERYENFLKLKKESDFYEMSYLEKRKKDKSFGKMVKNFKKNVKRR